MCSCNGNRQIAVDIRQDICAMMSLAVPVLIISIAATIVGAIIGHVGAAFFQILVHLILNLAILPTVGILFGAVLACGAKRGAAYIIIAVVTLSVNSAGGRLVCHYI